MGGPARFGSKTRRVVMIEQSAVGVGEANQARPDRPDGERRTRQSVRPGAVGRERDSSSSPSWPMLVVEMNRVVCRRFVSRCPFPEGLRLKRLARFGRRAGGAEGTQDTRDWATRSLTHQCRIGWPWTSAD
jgi:hypothetical protein